MSGRVAGWVQQGLQKHRAGDTDGAAELYERALAVEPTAFDPLQLLALIRFRGGRLAEGLALFERALAIAPRHASTLNNYGNALLAAGRWADAEGAYRAAIRATPRPAPVMFRNLGIALSEGYSGNDTEARQWLERALAGDPADAEAINRLAGLAVKRRDWPEADGLYTRSLAQRPSLAVRLARRMVRQNRARWEDWEQDVALFETATIPEDEQVDPFKIMFLLDNPATHRRYAEAFAAFGRRRAEAPPTTADVPPAPREIPPRRIRIGYLSADIRRHPVAQLVAGVMANHDRARFEVVVHALGPDCDDAERVRIRGACDRFISHAGLSEAQSVDLVRAQGHDLLIDLMGYTRDARLGILLARPARHVIGWLGYPGTLGGGLWDALVADATVIPTSASGHCSEEVLRLPECYLPADRDRAVNAPQDRTAYGFADDAVVMACFCQLQKITPALFGLWMRALAAEPSLGLWLFDAPPETADALRAHAHRQGVDPQRIRFAEFAPSHADHLARYEVADFAVDTFPYGSHSTAIDALWVGCPLVGFCGAGFPSRVSASVLRSAGVPELAAHSADDYLALILRLARDPALRHDLRHRLRATRSASPLFDVARFTAEFESVLLKFLVARDGGGTAPVGTPDRTP